MPLLVEGMLSLKARTQLGRKAQPPPTYRGTLPSWLRLNETILCPHSLDIGLAELQRSRLTFSGYTNCFNHCARRRRSRTTSWEYAASGVGQVRIKRIAGFFRVPHDENSFLAIGVYFLLLKRCGSRGTIEISVEVEIRLQWSKSWREQRAPR
jgi:hypothetical protein